MSASNRATAIAWVCKRHTMLLMMMMMMMLLHLHHTEEAKTMALMVQGSPCQRGLGAPAHPGVWPGVQARVCLHLRRKGILVGCVVAAAMALVVEEV